jgi:hypothetical protein
VPKWTFEEPLHEKGGIRDEGYDNRFEYRKDGVSGAWCGSDQQDGNAQAVEAGQVLAFFANLPPAVIGLEACAGADYWARDLISHRSS